MTDRPGNVRATYPRRLPSVFPVPHEIPAVDRGSAYADAACARYRVGQRGGAGDGGRLAHSLGTERADRGGHLDQGDVDRWDLVSSRHLVVEERCRAQLTVAVVDELFAKRASQRLDRAAVDLAHYLGRVDGVADV